MMTSVQNTRKLSGRKSPNTHLSHYQIGSKPVQVEGVKYAWRTKAHVGLPERFSLPLFYLVNAAILS
jgi:hypothetical protein